MFYLKLKPKEFLLFKLSFEVFEVSLLNSLMEFFCIEKIF